MTLTLPKLLLLLVIGWLVWTFLKRQNIIGSKKGDTASQTPRTTQRSERAVEDMVKCPKCGSYVPAKGGHDCAGA